MLFVLAAFAGMVACSHIDDAEGELTKLKFDQVIFRLKKDCSLDRQPEVTPILLICDAAKKIPR